jgi:hypothetical protein
VSDYLGKWEIDNMSHRDRTYTRILSVAFTLVAILAAIGVPSQGFCALVIDLPDITILGSNVLPTSGVLEVALTLTGPDLASPPSATSYNVDFTTDGSGLSFAAAQNATTMPLFASPIFSNFGTASNPKAAADTDGTSVATFNNAGLIKIPFTVAPGNLGTTYHLTLNSLTNEIANLGTAYPITLIGGSIFVTLPEAAAWKQLSLVALIGVTVMGAVKLRRRMEAR